MMSAAQSQTTLESKLKALQCHFTWDLETSRSVLLRRRDNLKDIGTEGGKSWLGHIYNLRGYIHYQLAQLDGPARRQSFIEDAQSFFNKAADAFRQMRNADEGPWLVVNYGNLAWLHHHLGDQAKSQAYLSKVDALMDKYPSPSQDELHPEICAEKAWTLMTFSTDKELARDYFEKAVEMQPDMVEWNTSHVLGLMYEYNHSRTGLDTDILEKMRDAKERDPENLYLAVHYLNQCARKNDRLEEHEARELARRVLKNPASSYSGIKLLLRVYRRYLSIDEAIDLAEEALENHPDNSYLKRCAALCYFWKISRDSHPKQSMIERAIDLHKEVISLYPHSSLKKKIDLANIYAKSNNGLTKAAKKYQKLLERSDLEPADEQMVYNSYAKYLYFYRHDSNGSIQYHIKAAKIQHQSSFRDNSIITLKKNRYISRMRIEIEECLRNLQEP